MLAYFGTVPIGVCVYQSHPNIPGAVEIESKINDFPGCSVFVGDTKITNVDMINFLLSQGYLASKVSDLYSDTFVLDVTLTKSF